MYIFFSIIFKLVILLFLEVQKYYRPVQRRNKNGSLVCLIASKLETTHENLSLDYQSITFFAWQNLIETT